MRFGEEQHHWEQIIEFPPERIERMLGEYSADEGHTQQIVSGSLPLCVFLRRHVIVAGRGDEPGEYFVDDITVLEGAVAGRHGGGRECKRRPTAMNNWQQEARGEA